ncbi:MAG TPA: DedA family protein [Ktedonobacterales bacterium]|jgi:membrane protein DedA with SNARE-associated domain
MSAPAWLDHLILTYGYWVVLVAVSLESMGVPFPGETTLLAAAVYAGTGKPLAIAWVIVFAAAGAIIGDNIGFTIGWFGGYPLARRILRLLRVREDTLDYARRFFERHGDKTVFLGRFFSLLRATVALLAGVNHMPRRTFFVWNGLGGSVWALLFGLLGYFLGRNIPLLDRVLRALGLAGLLAVVAFVGGLIVLWFIRRRRNEQAARAAIAAESHPPADAAADAAADEPLD